MDNSLIIYKLQELEGKIIKLIEENQRLREANTDLVSDNELLISEIERQKDEIKNFQNQDKITKLVSSIAAGAQNSTELKLKINEYIKELDKCIVFLSE